MSEKKISVYASIAEDILSKIKNDIYPIGSLLPAEREFMNIYKVQRTTVRRGLDMLCKQGYIRKAAGLGSVVESKVPTDKPTSEKAVITIVKEKTQNEPGNFAILLPDGKKTKSLDKLPSLLLDLVVSLGSFSNTFITTNEKEIENNCGIISIDREELVQRTDSVCLALSQSDDCRSVVTDNDKAAYMALTHLESFGHTSIAFIGTNSSFTFENSLYDSFSTVNSYFDEELVHLSGADEKSGFDGFSELFRRHGDKFTAICTANDAIAAGVIKAAKYYKINVPEDLSVISLCSSKKDAGFDSIYYNTDDLAAEISDSVTNCHRLSTVLFSGKLSVKGSVSAAKSKNDNVGKMSNFLL